MDCRAISLHMWGNLRCFRVIDTFFLVDVVCIHFHLQASCFGNTCLHTFKPHPWQGHFRKKFPCIVLWGIIVILSPLEYHMSTYFPNSRIDLSFQDLEAYFSKCLFLCITLYIFIQGKTKLKLGSKQRLVFQTIITTLGKELIEDSPPAELPCIYYSN